MKEKVKDYLEAVMIWFMWFAIVGTVFYIFYHLGKMDRQVLVEQPMKVYSDFRIEPMSEPGLVGVIDKKDLEKFLKIKDNIPFSKEMRIWKK